MIALVSPLRQALLVTPNGYYGAPRPQHTNGTPHLGLDFQASTGDAVLSSTAGTVARTGNDPPVAQGGGGGGNYVIVRATDGSGQAYELGYMHLATIAAAAGDAVSVGAQLGTVGATGTVSGGEHLHFQVKQLVDANTRQAVDPTRYLPIAGGAHAPATIGGGLVGVGALLAVIGWLVRRL